MGEFSDFSVRAVKDSGVSLPQGSANSGESQYSLYLFACPMQVQGSGFIPFHNGQTEELKERLTLTASLGTSESPVPGWPAGEWIWQLRGKHLLHPGRFHEDQPILAQLTESVGLLENALAGRLDATTFRSRLDRIGLPVDWRNHLATEVFRHAEMPTAPAKPLHLGGTVDPLAALLNQVDVGMESPAVGAAQQFISQVGSESTGFSLDKANATALLEAFRAFRKHMQAHAEQAGLGILFGWAAGMSALTKVIRGRSKQIGWMVAPRADVEAISTALTAHQGPVEILAMAGFETWDALWTPAYRALAAKASLILVQVPEGAFAEFRAEAKSSPWAAKLHLVSGAVRCAFGEESCAFKPAAFAYAEGCLAQQIKPMDAKHTRIGLDDQDPCPGRSERHVAVKLLPESEWLERARKGENCLNGKLGTASVYFLPLVAIEAAV